MKWAERPQPQPAPASNHSSLNWQGSSHGPKGVKSWITFSFLSLSNYPHPLTCSPSHSGYVWLASPLCYFYNAPYSPAHRQPQLPPISPPLSAWIGPHSITATHTDHTVLCCFTRRRHQSLTPTTYSCHSPLISHFLYFHVSLPDCFSNLFIMRCNHTFF